MRFVITIFSWRFSENFEVFGIFLLPQRSIIWIFFPLQWIRKRYSDAFLVAISCSFGSHGEKGVFWVVMFLYSGNCVYVLIVEFRLYLSLSLLSLSLYYRTELVSNGKNVCCSSIQSQRNWICIVSYTRHRSSFLTVRSVQESLGSINSASTTLASEDRIWEISESSKNAITERSCGKRKKLIERCLKNN